MDYKALAYSEKYEDGRISGTITLTNTSLTFTSGEEVIVLYKNDVTIDNGGTANRQIFIRSKTQSHSLSTGDKTILNHPFFDHSQHLQSHKRKVVSSFRTTKIILLSGFTLISILLATAIYNRSWIVKQLASNVPYTLEQKLGCSQVFDMEGGGMQFIAFEANDAIANEAEARRNPFLSQADMRAVLTRSLRLYLEGHGGRVPRRLGIHKTTAFTEGELKGVQDATQSIPEVECVEIGSSSAWRGVWMVEALRKAPTIQPARFPASRHDGHDLGKLRAVVGRWKCPIGGRRKGIFSRREEHSEANRASQAHGAWPLRPPGVRSHGTSQDGLEQRRPL